MPELETGLHSPLAFPNDDYALVRLRLGFLSVIRMRLTANPSEIEEITETRIQVTLTPSESKKLIAKAVKKLPEVQRALAVGTILLNKSTTNAYILNELAKEKVDVSKYASGIVTGQGTCIADSSNSLNLHILVKGELKEIVQPPSRRVSDVLADLLEHMGENDVFVKSANALDPWWHAAVLMAASKGSVEVTAPIIRRRNVNLLVPVGLEKLIPISVYDASREAGKLKMESSTGLPCDLVPIDGTVITELEAVWLLTGAVAVPIAAGGVSGAEGAVTLVVKGNRHAVHSAIQVLQSVKGEKAIRVQKQECSNCPARKKGQLVYPRGCPGFWSSRP